MSLEQQAEERKKRLARLRSMKQGASAIEVEVEAGQNSSTEADLQVQKGQASAIPAQDTNANDGETVEETAEKFGEDAVQKLQAATADDVKLDLEHLQPQDELADFKRYLQPKLDKLEERTNDAIYNLVKDRLKNLKPAD